MNCKVAGYAKLNFMLDILGTLPHGYHEVYMLMQSISLSDTVTLTETDSGRITVKCDIDAIPTDERNTAFRAATAFFETTGLPRPGLDIYIEKAIPHAAGLAGGSADAAAVLAGLNELYQTRMSERALMQIGRGIGADVPFCQSGGLMLAQYDGTVLSALPAPVLGPIVVVKPDCAVSTAEAYSAFDSAERVRHLDRGGMLRAVMQNDRDGIFQRIGNVFEQFIDVPERVVIKAILRNNGARCTCMSGSGPSVFGIFNDRDAAETAVSELQRSFSRVYLCDPVPQGVRIRERP